MTGMSGQFLQGVRLPVSLISLTHGVPSPQVPRSPEPSLRSSNTDPDRISSPDATRARCNRLSRAVHQSA